MPHDEYHTLRAKLAVFHEWPHVYLFKFIVPQEKRAELEALFAGVEYSTRESRNGRYVSLSCEREMPSSEAVIEVYRQVGTIGGSMAL